MSRRWVRTPSRWELLGPDRLSNDTKCFACVLFCPFGWVAMLRDKVEGMFKDRNAAMQWAEKQLEKE